LRVDMESSCRRLAVIHSPGCLPRIAPQHCGVRRGTFVARRLPRAVNEFADLMQARHGNVQFMRKNNTPVWPNRHWNTAKAVDSRYRAQML